MNPLSAGENTQHAPLQVFRERNAFSFPLHPSLSFWPDYNESHSRINMPHSQHKVHWQYILRQRSIPTPHPRTLPFSPPPLSLFLLHIHIPPPPPHLSIRVHILYTACMKTCICACCWYDAQPHLYMCAI